MKNILITGGAGFIGSNLVRMMVERYPDYNIVNLDNLTYAGNLENLSSVEASPNYTFIKGDICDGELVGRVFAERDIDGVLHLAAESHVDRSILGAEEFLRSNITGTYTLLECARQHWQSNNKQEDKSGADAGGRKFFVNVSTDEVYGSLGAVGVFTEDSPYAPNSPYSASKAAADHMTRAYHATHGLSAVSTHASNNYGPFQLPEKLLPLMILNALEGKPLPIYGRGENVRDWLYVDDHCSALDLVLHKGVPGRTYNIGGSNEWKNIDIVKLLCRLLDELAPSKDGSPYEKLIKFVTDRPGHDLRYAIDSSRLEKELGWSTEHDFESAVRETVKWYLENRGWADRVRSGQYMEYYDKNYGRR